jgi:hypothetical protein
MANRTAPIPLIRVSATAVFRLFDEIEAMPANRAEVILLDDRQKPLGLVAIYELLPENGSGVNSVTEAQFYADFDAAQALSNHAYGFVFNYADFSTYGTRVKFYGDKLPTTQNSWKTRDFSSPKSRHVRPA